MGIFPQNSGLPDRNALITEWKKLTPDQKKVYARFMEVYAGFLTYTDYEIGRVVDYLKQSGQLDNTLIFVAIGDNGASKEGTLQGTISQSLFSSAEKMWRSTQGKELSPEVLVSAMLTISSSVDPRTFATLL